MVSPFDLKEPTGIDEAIMALKGAHPEQPWDAVDADWQLPEDAKLEFTKRVAMGQKNMDMLVATFAPHFILREGGECVRLMDVYKQVPISDKEVELVFWNATIGRWIVSSHKEADAKYRRSLQGCIQSVLKYNANPCDDTQPWDLPCFINDSTWLQTPAKQSVESFLDIPFYNDLNGDKTRNYWMYSDGSVECRDNHIVRRADRMIPLTLTCGYPYPGAAIQALQDV